MVTYETVNMGPTIVSDDLPFFCPQIFPGKMAYNFKSIHGLRYLHYGPKYCHTKITTLKHVNSLPIRTAFDLMLKNFQSETLEKIVEYKLSSKTQNLKGTRSITNQCNLCKKLK